LLLPGAHAVGHTFVEVGRTDDGFDAPEPQPLSYGYTPEAHAELRSD
jgi:hypothetical protein